MGWPATYNPKITRGDGAALRLIFKTRDDVGVEELIDLSDSTLVFITNWRGGSIRKDSTNGGGIDIEDPETGEAVIPLSKAESAVLPIGRIARWKVERRWNDPDLGLTERTYVVGYLDVKDGTVEA